jgi:hypothetical protein
MLCTDVTKVANLEGPEELAAEDSPVRDCLPGRSFKQAVAAVCSFPFKRYVT